MNHGRLKKNYYRLPLSFVFAVLVVWVTSQQSETPYPGSYFEGNQLYQQGEYSRALEAFRGVVAQNEMFVQRYPWIQFKIGYCLYRTKRYAEAIENFQDALPRLEFIEDYVQYFTWLSFLALGDTLTVLKNLINFPRRYKDSPLLPWVDSLKAELYFRKGQLDSAMVYYKRMPRHVLFDKSKIYQKLLQIAWKQRDRASVKKYGFILIDNYPNKVQSANAYRKLRTILGESLDGVQLRKIVRYLATTGKFSEANSLLKSQVRKRGETELTRLLKIELLYRQNDYWKTLQACRRQRKKFRSRKHLRDVDLYMARSYLRLGNVERALSAYKTFQKRYPRDVLSPEVLWLIAWLYEEKGNLGKARGYYRQLLSRYPRSGLVPEARFRIGLSFYQEEKYTMARYYWEKTLLQEKDPFLQSRCQFWIAKTYLRQKNFVNYFQQLQILSQTPFASYYNLKAFLLSRDGTQIHQFVDSLLWEMHHMQTSYLASYLVQFRRLLIVQDILGKSYVHQEMNWLLNESKENHWKFLFAVAELYERFKFYGKAYRIFRNIYDQNFSEKDWHEWIFLFKRLYPLYFSEPVNRYAQKCGLHPSSLWAIMKKESAFEPQIVSYANAYGLMQIIPTTARELSRRLQIRFDGVQQLFDPEFNISLGAFYISELLRRYEGNLYYALAAYNAGPHRVDHWREIFNTEDDDLFMENIQFEQTRRYVRLVMQYYWTYSLLLNPQQMPENLFYYPMEITRQNSIRKSEILD